MRGFVTPLAESQALPAALNRYLKITLQDFLSAGRALAGERRNLHRLAAEALRAALTIDPRRTLACFGAPGVGTPIRCFIEIDRWPRHRERILAQFDAAMPHLLLELAARELIPRERPMDWPASCPRLVSPVIEGGVAFPEDVSGLRFKPGNLECRRTTGPTAEIPLRPGELDQAVGRSPGFELLKPYSRLRGATRLSVLDQNPIFLEEEHPDKLGNAVDLGGHPLEEWTRTLGDILDLISEHWPQFGLEMSTLLAQILPVGYHERVHNSASYRQALGSVYMTLHPNLLTMAEAVIHEFQHNKLNLASYEDPLLQNAFHPRYPSPVRPDPRPLWGVLLAVHAFLAVACFHRRLRENGHPLTASPDFERRLSEVDLKNHEGMELLRARADWTAAGKEVMAELDEFDRRHMAERAGAGLTLVATQAHDDS